MWRSDVLAAIGRFFNPYHDRAWVLLLVYGFCALCVYLMIVGFREPRQTPHSHDHSHGESHGR